MPGRRPATRRADEDPRRRSWPETRAVPARRRRGWRRRGGRRGSRSSSPTSPAPGLAGAAGLVARPGSALAFTAVRASFPAATSTGSTTTIVSVSSGHLEGHLAAAGLLGRFVAGAGDVRGAQQLPGLVEVDAEAGQRPRGGGVGVGQRGQQQVVRADRGAARQPGGLGQRGVRGRGGPHVGRPRLLASRRPPMPQP